MLYVIDTSEWPNSLEITLMSILLANSWLAKVAAVRGYRCVQCRPAEEYSCERGSDRGDWSVSLWRWRIHSQSRRLPFSVPKEYSMPFDSAELSASWTWILLCPPSAYNDYYFHSRSDFLHIPAFVVLWASISESFWKPILSHISSSASHKHKPVNRISTRPYPSRQTHFPFP